MHEDAEAVVRLTTPSAAGTPLVRDLCAECAQETFDGFSLFGLPPNTEVEWFEDDSELQETYESIRTDN